LVRVGFGTDSHRFEEKEERPLILGSVKLSDTGGLAADSDGDVILHAVFNAVSQACGGESLGYYADPLYKKGITDSTEYLKIAIDMVERLGYRIGNIGIMVEAYRPRLAMADIGRIKTAIAGLLSISVRDVGMTFTSGEGLTSFGRGKGILVQSVVTLLRREG
jgi:2-C-methyl-D-erythritol 2,4-cyclodiphosphate synthase